MPLIGLLVRKASKRMRKLSIQVQNTMGDVNHVVQESINGNSVVKPLMAKPQNNSAFISLLRKTSNVV
jgi:subfamily B ATP-binding cassette protein MsbA